jgi:hypothetical protein
MTARHQEEHTTAKRGPRRREGAVLFLVAAMMSALTVLGTSLYVLTSADVEATRHSKLGTDALYQADAGVQYVSSHIMADIEGGILVLDTPVEPVTYNAPAGFTFDTVTQLKQVGDSSLYRFEVTGRSLNAETTVEALVEHRGGFPFDFFGAAGTEMLLGAQATGNAGSNGNIDLSGSSDITGDAIPGPGHTTTLAGGSTVSGSTTPATTSVVLEPIDPAALAGAAVDNNNGVIDPGYLVAGVLTLHNQDVTLPEGTYYFAGIDMYNDGDIFVTGPVAIFCTGDISLDLSSEINNAGDPNDVRIYCTTAGSITVNDRSDLYGHVYAPQASLCAVTDQANAYGTMVCGGTARLSDSKLSSVGEGGNPRTARLVSWKEVR